MKEKDGYLGLLLALAKKDQKEKAQGGFRKKALLWVKTGTVKRDYQYSFGQQVAS